MASDKPVSFSEDGAKRIASAVRFIEGSPRGTLRGERRGPLEFGQPILRVKSPAGGIAAMTGSTPGSATCTLEAWNGSARSTGSGTITVRNDHPTAVGASKLLWVVWWQGDYWVMTEAC